MDIELTYELCWKRENIYDRNIAVAVWSNIEKIEAGLDKLFEGREKINCSEAFKIIASWDDCDLQMDVFEYLRQLVIKLREV